MQKLSETDIIMSLTEGKLFEAELENGSLYIRVREYVPYLCTAIHAGHQLRPELSENCCLNEDARLREEDPYTNQMIDAFPVILVAKDSRYEYDLNRAPDACIYENAWGKSVWKKKLTSFEIEQSVAKHDKYYRILKVLVQQLESRFGGCMLIDLHSYNWKVRAYEHAPVFNIGTARVNVQRWNKTLRTLEQELSMVSLPHLTIDIARNRVFKGFGYQAAFIREHFNHTLLVPIEIKKVYMDELTGQVYPLVLDKLRECIYLAVVNTAVAFNKRLRASDLKTSELLPAEIEPIVLKVDKALYRLVRGLETLNCVNPINVLQEKRRFYAQRNYQPQLRYRQLKVDPYEFKEHLYQLPVSEIQEPMIRGLYRDAINNFAIKIDMLTHIGTSQFLYNSLRYYGRPSPRDIENAKFILHAPEVPGWEVSEEIRAAEGLVNFEVAAEKYGLDCTVLLSNKIVAKAMVDNSRGILYINQNAVFSNLEMEALIHHELGVHMLTTMNSMAQPLNLFKLGLPGNTYTQEGLAILSEYYASAINMARLKQLALRVLAVDMMVCGLSFSAVYRRLHEENSVSAEEAFGLTIRVFRGGGFTKDYLYLCGFRDMVAMAKSRKIDNLLIGKTGANYIDTLDQLVARGILNSPKLMAKPFQSLPLKTSAILDYVISAIR